jgi:Cytochrome c oxidase caa3 assembly factor (Caa3_CtaG)
VLVPRCRRVRANGSERPLDQRGRRRLLRRADELAEQGYRVLMVAEGPRDTSPEDPQELSALGFLGIRDPIRAGVPAAVDRCREAGVRVIMTTGARCLGRLRGRNGFRDRLVDRRSSSNQARPSAGPSNTPRAAAPRPRATLGDDRRRVGAGRREPGARRSSGTGAAVLHWLARPPVGLALFCVALAAWHLSPLYDATLRSTAIHELEHAMFLATGLLFWSH